MPFIGRSRTDRSATVPRVARPSFCESEASRTYPIRLCTQNQVMGTPTIYQGPANTAVIRVGEFFREAVRHAAVAMIMVHNHLSGDPTPTFETWDRAVGAMGSGPATDCAFNAAEHPRQTRRTAAHCRVYSERHPIRYVYGQVSGNAGARQAHRRP